MSASTTVGYILNNLVILLCGAYNSLICQTPRMRTTRFHVKLEHLQLNSEAVNLRSLTSYLRLTVGKAQTPLSMTQGPCYEVDV
jgi:hypothetical protein